MVTIGFESHSNSSIGALISDPDTSVRPEEGIFSRTLNTSWNLNPNPYPSM